MRPTLVKFGSLISLIGAIIAIIAFSENAMNSDSSDIPVMLVLLLVILLFFASMGNFYEGGISKSQPLTLTLIAFNIVAIIALFAISNAFNIEYLLAMLICALIPAFIAVSESDWFQYEKI